MAVFVVFASKAAFAQDDAAEVTVLEVDPRSHDELRVDWKWAATNSDTADIEGFSLRYQEGAAFVNTKSIMRMDVDFNKDDDDYRVILEELKPDTEYIVGVTAIAKDAGDMDSDEMTSTGTTDPADEPDDVRNLMLHVGDSMIMAMWDEATDNGSEVTGYEVQIKESDESDSKYESVRDGDDDDTSTEWAISNLENGMEYSVRVRAYSYDAAGDWSDEEMATPMEGAMIPTPALPLFGAFALGAGVLAAGRARLRRREQRRLTR